MANYTTSVSDKKKKTCLILLVAGFLGFHAFYVGKIKWGIIHFLLGSCFWAVIIDGIKTGESPMIAAGLVGLIAVCVPELFKILTGTYRDNIGNVIRA